MSESSPDPEWSPGLPLQAGPFAILVGAALWLARHFYELPERIPIHWNWRGKADEFVGRRVLLAGEYFAALICCGVLAASVTSGRLLKPVLWLTFAAVVGLVLLAARTGRGIPREPERNPSAWRAGVFYVDRNDPALFVPKRAGFGYTFNFGHPAALLLTLLTLVVPLAVALGALLLR